ncbi:MAG: pyridoxamine 5'-phosphate oxidase [Kiritimatiellae bacterium]|nr:pyridoxamine 5'-phosphate oxidase [Kiritimatiellia bacterium]
MSLWTKFCSLKGLLLGLDERSLDSDPIVQFQRWYRFARRAGSFWPDSFCLSTVGADGHPAARMLLLKGCDQRGLVFYTHYVGRKADELARTPHAALTFHWPELIRQVRVEGPVERVSEEESDAYFRSRQRGSQIGAWVSHQSRPLANRKEFDRAYREYRQRIAGGPVPRPPHWGGYRVFPVMIEFWQGRPARLHDRFRYERQANGAWTRERLYP